MARGEDRSFAAQDQDVGQSIPLSVPLGCVDEPTVLLVLSGFYLSEEGRLEGRQRQEMAGARRREVFSELQGEISDDGEGEGVSSGGIGQM